MPEPYYSDAYCRIYHGDCRDILQTLPEAGYIPTCLTDPPYGLSFMNRDWDKTVPGSPYWQSISNALLPGGLLLAFGGTRTFHRLACAIEDAGWELRDTLMWLFASGFPKNLDISKAIDKAVGAAREPPTTEAQTWQGWGTALAPAYEPIILAQKPLDGTYAQNALQHGVAGLYVDGDGDRRGEAACLS